jgi:tetratricopeptide (TPR) repeat protein
MAEASAGHEELADEVGELAYVGPSAPLRRELIDAAVAAVASPLPTIEDHLDDDELAQVAEAVLRHAVQSRKDGRFEQALTSYAGAIARSLRLDASGWTATALRGAGLCYLELARAALAEDGKSALLQSGGSTSLGAIITAWQRALQRRALGLAERSRACQRGALELQKMTGSIGGQASELANLALTEKLLGNHDTARGYLVWAMRTHRAVGDRKAADIDVVMLAALEREVGDEEAAAEWEAGSEGAW